MATITMVAMAIAITVTKVTMRHVAEVINIIVTVVAMNGKQPALVV